MGTPTVFLEKMLGGQEFLSLIHLVDTQFGKKPTHLMSAEIGGVNAMTPLMQAERLKLPVVDGDLIGRAFPEIHMNLTSLILEKSSPIFIADEKGNYVFIHCLNTQWNEKIVRHIALDMGGTGLIALPLETRIAGIRINFRMPHLLSIGIGGGSKVNPMTAQVGPKSVGYQLQKKAFIFGGSILTASDLAVAASWMNLGKHHYVKHIDPSFIAKGLKFIQETIYKSIKTLSKIDGQQCLVLVGGTHQLLGTHLTGFKQVIRPKYAEIANAIGAAIGQVSSEVNKVVDFSKTPRVTYCPGNSF